jgi:hypothetical protein
MDHHPTSEALEVCYLISTDDGFSPDRKNPGTAQKMADHSPAEACVSEHVVLPTKPFAALCALDGPMVTAFIDAPTKVDIGNAA